MAGFISPVTREGAIEVARLATQASTPRGSDSLPCCSIMSIRLFSLIVVSVAFEGENGLEMITTGQFDGRLRRRSEVAIVDVLQGHGHDAALPVAIDPPEELQTEARAKFSPCSGAHFFR
jgi:hypothetical protein